jgi:hypothetical protein
MQVLIELNSQIVPFDYALDSQISLRLITETYLAFHRECVDGKIEKEEQDADRDFGIHSH